MPGDGSDDVDRLGRDCYDNAMAESLFATLECELLQRRSFKTQAEARMAIFEWKCFLRQSFLLSVGSDQ